MLRERDPLKLFGSMVRGVLGVGSETQTLNWFRGLWFRGLGVLGVLNPKTLNPKPV